MSTSSQSTAIRGLRQKYPNVGQRTFASAVVTRNSTVISNFDDRVAIDTHNLTQLTFAAVYGIVRRYDASVKQPVAA